MASKVAIEVEITNVKKIADLKNSLKNLRKQQKLLEGDAKKNQDSGKHSTAQYVKNAKAIDKKSRSLRNLNKDLRQNTKVSKSNTKSAKGFGQGLSLSMLKGAGAIGAVISALAVLGRVFSQAINTFSAFEFQMAKVKAVTGATAREFDILSHSARELGRTTFFTATQVAELQSNYGKLGFSTQEILDAQEATIQLATATGSDLGRAAIVAGSAVRGFGLDASETQRVVDVMAVSFTSSALDIEKWQTSMTKVAPIAKSAGFSIEDTAAIMAQLADSGIEASIAGTSLRNILLKMQDPNSALTKSFGKTIHSFDDLIPAMKKFIEEGGSMADIMEVVDLRQAAAFEQMLTSADSAEALREALKNANGEAKKMADIMADTIQGDMKELTSAWEGFQISVFTGSGKITQSIRNILDVTTELFNILTDYNKTNQELGLDKVGEQMSIVNTQIKDQVELFKTLSVEDQKIYGKTKIQFIEERIGVIRKEITANDKLRSHKTLMNKSIDDEIKKSSVLSSALFELTTLKAKEIELVSKATKVQEKKTKAAQKERNTLGGLKKELSELKTERDLIGTTNKKGLATNRKKIDSLQKLIDKIDGVKKATKSLSEEEKKQLEKKEFLAQKNEFKVALQEEINADKKNLIDKVITKEEYNARVLEAEKSNLENLRDLKIAYGLEVSDIDAKILDNTLKGIEVISEAKAKAAQKLIDENLKQQKDKEQSITQMKEIGNQLIFIAGEEEKLQELKKIGIQLSQAAAIAAGFEAMNKYSAAIADTALNSPWWLKIINVVGLIGAMASTMANIKALKNSMGDGGMIEEFANGGMVNGKSHAQGGEKFSVGGRVVELEGGEAVINKRSTQMFRGQLSSMNEAGGGVKFADGGLMSSPSFTESSFAASNQSQMMGVMQVQRRVVVVESDITDSQSTVSVIQSNATF